MSVAYYFSSKMARLIILLGPIASSLGGVALEAIFKWSIVQVSESKEWMMTEEEPRKEAEKKEEPKQSSKRKAAKVAKKQKPKGPVEELAAVYEGSKQPRLALAVLMLVAVPLMAPRFYSYCD